MTRDSPQARSLRLAIDAAALKVMQLSGRLCQRFRDPNGAVPHILRQTATARLVAHSEDRTGEAVSWLQEPTRRTIAVGLSAVISGLSNPVPEALLPCAIDAFNPAQLF